MCVPYTCSIYTYRSIYTHNAFGSYTYKASAGLSEYLKGQREATYYLWFSIFCCAHTQTRQEVDLASGMRVGTIWQWGQMHCSHGWLRDGSQDGQYWGARSEIERATQERQERSRGNVVYVCCLDVLCLCLCLRPCLCLFVFLCRCLCLCLCLCAAIRSFSLPPFSHSIVIVCRRRLRTECGSRSASTHTPVAIIHACSKFRTFSALDWSQVWTAGPPRVLNMEQERDDSTRVDVGADFNGNRTFAQHFWCNFHYSFSHCQLETAVEPIDFFGRFRRLNCWGTDEYYCFHLWSLQARWKRCVQLRIDSCKSWENCLTASSQNVNSQSWCFSTHCGRIWTPLSMWAKSRTQTNRFFSQIAGNVRSLTCLQPNKIAEKQKEA